jgi:hypothetical protein
MASYTNISNPKTKFNTKLYAGTGSSNAITGVGHQPDFIWLKSRTNAEYHVLYDSVRGSASNYKQLYSNATNAEVTPGTPGLTAIGSDGFTLGANDNSNNSSENFVSWNWKANGQGSSNTDGTINSTYTSADQTSGFSIVTYTGTGSSATVGHGLGATPSSIFIKELGNANNWHVWHDTLSATQYLLLDSNNGKQNYAPVGIGTMTNTTFSLGTVTGVNRSGGTYVAYVFSNRRGFSRIGRYVGNASTVEAPMINCGFKPAWVLIKNADASENWRIYDDKRDAHNHMYKCLFPNATSVENSTNNESEEIDFLANGFKIRSNAAQLNGSGQDMFYWAFASEPTVNGLGNPATAR